MWIFFIVVEIIFVVYVIGALRARRVPYVRSAVAARRALVQNLQLKSGDVFIELGCGDGATLAAVTAKFTDIRARGYEVLPYAYWLARYSRRRDKYRYDVLLRNFMHANLSDANVLYCFLLPHVMSSVWEKISRECKPGTLLYSNVFTIPGVTPVQGIFPQDEKGRKYPRVFVYQVRDDQGVNSVCFPR